MGIKPEFQFCSKVRGYVMPPTYIRGIGATAISSQPNFYEISPTITCPSPSIVAVQNLTQGTFEFHGMQDPKRLVCVKTD